MTHYLIGTEIRAALIARPFKRFTIHMKDGLSFEIRDPELVMAPADSQIIVLYRGQGAYTMIDVPTINSVDFDKPNGSSRRRRRKAG